MFNPMGRYKNKAPTKDFQKPVEKVKPVVEAKEPAEHVDIKHRPLTKFEHDAIEFVTEMTPADRYTREDYETSMRWNHDPRNGELGHKTVRSFKEYLARQEERQANAGQEPSFYSR